MVIMSEKNKTNFVRLFLCLLLLFVLASCAPSRSFRNNLYRAEKLLGESPDSSILILTVNQPAEATPRHLKARHALLLSMAFQACSDVPSSDSLARYSYEYYWSHGSCSDKMHSANCLAEVEYANGRLTDAILHYHDALSCAVDLRDTRMEGFISQRLGELFALNYDHEEALQYASHAARCLELADEPLSASFSRLDQARQYLALGKTSFAQAIADSLSPSNGFQDAGFDYYLNLLKADICNAKDDEESALSYYHNAMKTGFMLPLTSMAQYLLLIEKRESQSVMDSLAVQMEARVKTGLDSIVYQGVLMEQARIRGNYTQAYQHLTLLSDIQNRTFTSAFSQSVTHALKAYFQEQYRLEHLRRQTQILLMALVILLLTIAMAATIVVLRRRRLRIEQEMSLVETLSRDMELIQNSKKRLDTVVAALVQDKIKSMSRLTETYFSWTDEAVRRREIDEGRSTKEEIISSFRHELKNLRSDRPFLESVEEALNQSQGQIMRNLRADFSGLNPHLPKFKEKDFLFLMLFFAGFSNKSVGFFMDLTDEAVRSKKKRCKQLFLSLPEDQGKQYADLL